VFSQFQPHSRNCCLHHFPVAKKKCPTPARTQSARNRTQIEPACIKLQMLCPGVTFGKKVGRRPRSQIGQPKPGSLNPRCVTHLAGFATVLPASSTFVPPSEDPESRFWQQIGLRARRELSADPHGSRSGGHMPSMSHVGNGHPNLVFATPSRSVDQIMLQMEAQTLYSLLPLAQVIRLQSCICYSLSLN